MSEPRKPMSPALSERGPSGPARRAESRAGMISVAERWAEVDDRVEAAAQRSGPRYAATCGSSPRPRRSRSSRSEQLVAAGCTDLGENRAQELLDQGPPSSTATRQ